MSGQCSARPTAQEAKAVVEASRNLSGAQGGDTGRSELDGQRDPVQTTAQLSYGGSVCRRQHESGVGVRGPRGEQPHTVEGGEALRRQIVGQRDRERGGSPYPLASNSK